MYISAIFASGFRCFPPAAPLRLKLLPGLNILVGPNDAGKSAIVDAARYVLWTRDDDYVRPDVHDFHVDAAGNRVCDFVVRCTFDGLNPDEESRFLEWCTNEKGKLRLHVRMHGALRASPGGGSIVSSQYRAGAEGEGFPLDGELREYLKATYLRPLRDAERELRSGKRSRLSRILGAMPSIGPQAHPGAPGGPNTLFDTLAAADAAVRSNAAIVDVQDKVNTSFLGKLSFSDDPLAATLDLGAKHPTNPKQTPSLETEVFGQRLSAAFDRKRQTSPQNGRRRPYSATLTLYNVLRFWNCGNRRRSCGLPGGARWISNQRYLSPYCLTRSRSFRSARHRQPWRLRV